MRLSALVWPGVMGARLRGHDVVLLSSEICDVDGGDAQFLTKLVNFSK